MQRRYVIWPFPDAVAQDYELAECHRVFEVIQNEGRPTELVVGEGCEEPDVDCVAIYEKKSPINRMNILLWNEQTWFWINVHR